MDIFRLFGGVPIRDDVYFIYNKAECRNCIINTHTSKQMKKKKNESEFFFLKNFCQENKNKTCFLFFHDNKILKIITFV